MEVNWVWWIERSSNQVLQIWYGATPGVLSEVMNAKKSEAMNAKKY